MLTLAAHVAVDLDLLELARRRLAAHEREYDRSFGAVRRNERALLIEDDIELAAAVERGGEA
jgi:hypothetical protein